MNLREYREALSSAHTDHETRLEGAAARLEEANTEYQREMVESREILYRSLREASESFLGIEKETASEIEVAEIPSGSGRRRAEPPTERREFRFPV